MMKIKVGLNMYDTIKEKKKRYNFCCSYGLARTQGDIIISQVSPIKQRIPKQNRASIQYRNVESNIHPIRYIYEQSVPYPLQNCTLSEEESNNA